MIFDEIILGKLPPVFKPAQKKKKKRILQQVRQICRKKLGVRKSVAATANVHYRLGTFVVNINEVTSKKR